MISHATVLFVKAKQFDWLDPNLRLSVKDLGISFQVTVEASALGKYVELDLDGADAIFSDNYFDISGEAKRIVTIDKQSMSIESTVMDLIQRLKVRSLYDMA